MVRLGFAEALGKIGTSATPLLLDGLANHPNPVVRRACAKTLTLICDPTTVPHLIYALLNDEDTVVKGSAVGALAKNGETSVPPLLEILAAPEHPESTKGHAAWALGFIGVQGKEQLYAAIASEVAEVRSAVVGAIANILEEQPEERGFKLLIDGLQDTVPSVRSEAAAALGKLAYQPAVPHLLDCLEHQDGETRKAAALGLMKISDRATLDALQTALAKENEESAQRAIALAISQIQRQTNDEDNWDI